MLENGCELICTKKSDSSHNKGLVPGAAMTSWCTPRHGAGRREAATLLLTARSPAAATSARRSGERDTACCTTGCGGGSCMLRDKVKIHMKLTATKAAARRSSMRVASEYRFRPRPLVAAGDWSWRHRSVWPRLGAMVRLAGDRCGGQRRRVPPGARVVSVWRCSERCGAVGVGVAWSAVLCCAVLSGAGAVRGTGRGNLVFLLLPPPAPPPPAAAAAAALVWLWSEWPGL